MNDLWASLPWEAWPMLLCGALLAGLVRGFTGFGTAMVFMPFAAQVLDPFAVITVLVSLDILGPMPVVRKTLKDANLPDLKRLAIGLLIGAPFGVLLLSALSPLAFRYSVSLFTLILLVMLVCGFRYRGPMTPRLVTTTGTLGGLLGGSVGLSGPPVILLYMASSLPVQVIRANILLYLILSDVVLLALFAVLGQLQLVNVLTGLLVIPPYALALILGAKLFDPARERVYRWSAYAIIAGSVLSGLPFFD